MNDIDLQGCWLHHKGAARYLDISPLTLTAKLRAGTGPKSYKSPGSLKRIFWTPDLDDWVLNSPKRLPTPGEQARTVRLQAGAERVREKQRAQRQAEDQAADEQVLAKRQACLAERFAFGLPGVHPQQDQPAEQPHAGASGHVDEGDSRAVRGIATRKKALFLLWFRLTWLSTTYKRRALNDRR